MIGICESRPAFPPVVAARVEAKVAAGRAHLVTRITGRPLAAMTSIPNPRKGVAIPPEHTHSQ
jgi:hypothetical protein